MNTFIWSPLDQFEIRPLLSINNDLTFALTNYNIYLLLIIFIFTLYYGFINNNNIVSNNWGVTILSIYDTILNMVKSQINNGPIGGAYFPLIFTLFNFILLANTISMIPYSFAISAQLILIISLSLSLWIGLTILGLSKHGLGFFALFVPTGTPLALVPILVLIETLSYTSRAISLGLRLSANILSGHLLMLILGSLIFNLISSSILGLVVGVIPVVGVIAIVILEFAISIIQSYVFCILLSSYIKDVVYLH